MRCSPRRSLRAFSAFAALTTFGVASSPLTLFALLMTARLRCPFFSAFDDNDDDEAKAEADVDVFVRPPLTS